MKSDNGGRDLRLDLVLGVLTGRLSQQTQDCIASNGDVNQQALTQVSTSRQDNHKLKADGYNSSREFIVLPSRKLPRWLLPLGNPAIAVKSFDIYAPYARSGRILKWIANGLLLSGWTGFPQNRVLVSFSGRLPLEELVHQLTGESHPIFSFSMGAPGRFQKLTVQVMGPDGAILGYMKLPLTELAQERVRHEAAVLKGLENSALRPYVPRLLYAGPWEHGYLVFQSALTGAPGPTVLTSKHDKLLNTMHEVHSVSKPGPALVEYVAQRWRNFAPQLGRTWNEIGNEILHCCAQGLASRSVVWGLMHGDFTPWNSKLSHCELLVFDWESAEEEAPLDWDLFHFHVQTASCLRRQLSLPRKDRGVECYWLYLLYSVARLAEAGPTTKPAIDYRERLARDQLESRPGKWAATSAAPLSYSHRSGS